MFKYAFYLGGVTGTIETSGANAKTALTSISENIKAGGTGQVNSLNSLLTALRDLDTNNENGLDGIVTNIINTKNALTVLASRARHGYGHHTYHGSHGYHHTRHSNHTTAPEYVFIDESTVNLQPEQSNNQQTGIKATAGSFSDDKNNPSSGGSKCGNGFLTSIGCNIKLQLGRSLLEDDSSANMNNITSQSPKTYKAESAPLIISAIDPAR